GGLSAVRCLVLGGWGVAEAGVRAGAVVPVDPGSIRTALPDARIAVDKWHLVALANLMVT
ncbi:hypothetical protein, partial [Gordonia bronchialis]|uniref:hypothetical protein n=1 Tax=Gordonia bronchialis TaxID=2054 RepID=UPI00226D8E05